MRKRFRPPKHDALKVGRTHGFGLLLDAVLNEPHKVRAIVSDNPGIVHETCWVGENVLHWLAIENRYEEIELLRSVGSPIPTYALVHAVEQGNTESVIKLLEMGVEFISSDIESAIHSKTFSKDKKTKSLLIRYFRQYGCEI